MLFHVDDVKQALYLARDLLIHLPMRFILSDTNAFKT